MTEMARYAEFDKNMAPQQHWYDTLRGSDDGSFGKPDEETAREMQ